MSHASLEAVFQTQDLHFSRGNRAILSGVNMRFESGKTTALMGPSGIGKTTLLKLLTGQIKPDSGAVLFYGKPIDSMSQKTLYLARQKMGVLFQSGALFTDMNVYDNVAFPLREIGKESEASIYEKVIGELEEVGLRGAKALMPRELSGGMARRVAFARTMIAKPEVVLFDEPFTGQDPISKGVLVKLIASVKKRNISAVLISHDIKETLMLADYAYILSSGKVMAEGKSDTINASDNEAVRQFLDGRPDGPIPFHLSADPLSEDLAHNPFKKP